MSQHRSNAKSSPDDEIEAVRPDFRFAQLQSRQQSPLVSTESATLKAPPGEVIQKSDYMKAEEKNDNCNWVVSSELRTVPAFYPLEKSSRLVDDDPQEIATRLSETFRKLSIQAIYEKEGTAELVSGENVEMHLSLWKTPGAGSSVVVELQRRKGDSIAFHRYCRAILDAAIGEDLLGEIGDDVVYSKKVQRLLSLELGKSHMEAHESAVVAIEIAHGLIMKDRMDARRLGLESLCLLTDPRKTGYITAVLCSHVVLLGTTNGVEIPGAEKAIVMDEGIFQGVHETILGLVQFSRIGEDEQDDEMEINPDTEHITILHNLALAVLANALDVIEHPERYDEYCEDEEEPEDTKPRGRLRTASSSDVANEFLQQTTCPQNSKKEVLSTLIAELGKADAKPHDATLSAKCLGSLLRASDEARRKAKDLGAKCVVQTALDVGVRTHLKLETECKKVVKELERQTETVERPSETEN